MNDKVYHVTQTDNLRNIIKEGLLPQIGKYAKTMGETEPGIWVFPNMEDALEMIPVWLEPFYGNDLSILEISLPNNAEIESTGSEYEYVLKSPIRPEYIRIVI